MTAANDALAFALELALLAALARFGWTLTDHVAGQWALAIGLAAIAAALWGHFAAPRSPARLTGWALAGFKLALFGLAAAALAYSGMPRLGALLAALALANIALAIRLDVL